MTRMGGTWQNWGRTEAVRPRLVERPATVEAVQRAVEAAGRAGMRVKPIGAGHSFSGIAVAPDVLLELEDLSGVVEVDRDRRRVRLLAGTRLHRIPALLAPFGLDASDPSFWAKGLGLLEGLIDQLEATMPERP